MFVYNIFVTNLFQTLSFPDFNSAISRCCNQNGQFLTLRTKINLILNFDWCQFHIKDRISMRDTLVVPQITWILLFIFIFANRLSHLNSIFSQLHVIIRLNRAVDVVRIVNIVQVPIPQFKIRAAGNSVVKHSWTIENASEFPWHEYFCALVTWHLVVLTQTIH